MASQQDAASHLGRYYAHGRVSDARAAADAFALAIDRLAAALQKAVEADMPEESRYRVYINPWLREEFDRKLDTCRRSVEDARSP